MQELQSLDEQDCATTSTGLNEENQRLREVIPSFLNQTRSKTILPYQSLEEAEKSRAMSNRTPTKQGRNGRGSSGATKNPQARNQTPIAESPFVRCQTRMLNYRLLLVNATKAASQNDQSQTQMRLSQGVHVILETRRSQDGQS